MIFLVVKRGLLRVVHAAYTCNRLFRSCLPPVATPPAPEHTRALSIQQPWAWLIVNGHKDVENRTWRTKHRGPFLVHAGKGFDQAGYDYVAAHFPDIALPSPADFERGGLVGAATLVECFEPGSDLSGVCTSPWYFGQYGFSLADAKPMVFVPLKGLLNFFRVLPA